MWNLQLSEDVDKKLDRANMYLGVIADVLADIADILTAKQAERRTINMDTIKILEDMESQQAGIMEKAALADAILAAAQPERKKGKWIRHDEIKNVYGGICIECSECGEKYVVQHILDEKYCRNCGADMRGEQDE